MLRSQHAEATRRAVLAAARSLFGRNGYALTSVDEIADAARVTKGAVYHHFAGKEALFRAVLLEVEAELETRAAGAGDPAEPPIDQIVARMNAYLDAALDEELRRIVLIDAPAVLGVELEESAGQEPGHLDMRSFIAAAVERGQIIGLDPDVLTHLIRGLAWLGGMRITRASDRDATRAAVGEALDAMLRGLAPAKSP
ncbi:MAG TPA: helix-turn-helix domain-containing protein [Streptosporangiaceae bacterium]